MAGETPWTAGPWRVEGPTDFPNPNVGMWEVEGATNICTHCTLYDARLIAAARELYAALDDLLCFYTDGAPRTASRRLAVHDNARAALAKAEGKQP